MIDKCSQCGICCRVFLVNLTEVEYRSGKYRTQFEEFGLMDDFYKASACGANILKQKEDGGCIYLKANKCLIHKIRPQVCRDFFCTSKLKKFRKMIKQIERKQASLGPTHSYYLYILRCCDHSLYCGQTNNLKRRIQEHSSDEFRSAKYTKGRRPVKLVYFEKYKTVNEVMKREYEIKKWTKAKKEALVKK